MRTLITSLTLIAGLTAADTYQVDNDHAEALFTVSHMGISETWGRFNDVGGTIVWDDAKPDASSVKIVIQAASIDTGVADKDKHLRAGDFFSVKEFPELSFVSSKIEAKDGAYLVTGAFTLRGVTKTITVPVRKIGAGKDPMGKERIGFGATFTIERNDYGMTFAGGGPVAITLSLEGVR